MPAPRPDPTETDQAEAGPSRWADPAPHRPVPFWEAVRCDVVAHVPVPLRRSSRLGWLRMVAWVFLRSSGFHVTLGYRVGHSARAFGPPGKAVAGLLFWWNRHAYGCSIASSARLHGGLILPHPQGIVVGAHVVVGPRAWLFQNVTLGGSPGKAGMPAVGSDARIYAGAVLTGPIIVGDNVMVGANAVVARDVPDRTVVRSAPVEFAPLPPAFRSDGV